MKGGPLKQAYKAKEWSQPLAGSLKSNAYKALKRPKGKPGTASIGRILHNSEVKKLIAFSSLIGVKD